MNDKNFQRLLQMPLQPLPRCERKTHHRRANTDHNPRPRLDEPCRWSDCNQSHKRPTTEAHPAPLLPQSLLDEIPRNGPACGRQIRRDERAGGCRPR